MTGRYKTVLSLLRPHRRLVALIVVLQLFGSVGQVASIMLLKPLLNEGIYADMDHFVFLASVLILMTMIIAIVLISTTVLASHVATSVAEALRLAIVDSALSVDDLRSLGSNPTDAMVCLTNDVDSVQSHLFETLRTYLPMPMLLLLLLFFTFETNLIVGVIMVVTIAVISVVSYVFTVRIRPYYMEQVRCMGEINVSLREKVLGARTIRAYNGYDYEVKKFAERSAKIGAVNRKIAMNSYYIPSIAVACMWIFIVILFVVSALEEGTSLKAAEIIIFMQFATAIVSTLALVSYICLAAPRARACFLHIRGLVRRANASRDEPEYDDRVANTANCVSAKDVVLRSASGETAMEGLNLGILRGRTVTIMGPNGSGASHLINMILGFERPESGTFLVDGRDVSTSDPKVIRSGISYANSSLHILRGTLRFNLDPHEVHTDEELLEMCGRLGLTEYVAELPDGLDTNINDAVSSMSGGQKLLVIFARSLLKDVPIYIFDDCLFSLDNETKARVLNLISEVCEGRSVIFHMHDTSTCEFSDEIFVMAGGKIVGHGSHSELLESSELYNDLFKTGQGRYGSWA